MENGTTRRRPNKTAARRTPKERPQSGERGFWRVSTMPKGNIDRAVAAGLWGTSKGIGMKNVRPGDRIVFYVSGWSRDAGYWGVAKVTSAPFVSHTEVWYDDIYPVRIKIVAERPLVSRPVTSAALKTRLGGRRLTFLRQAGVIALTAAEYDAIAGLLASPARKNP